MENKQAWLDSLKVGDEVAMDLGSFGHRRYVIATVEKITPTRRITTSNRLTFNSNGSQYGVGRDSWSTGTYLRPVTEDILGIVLRDQLLGELKSTKFEELTTDQLSSIKEIIKSK